MVSDGAARGIDPPTYKLKPGAERRIDNDMAAPRCKEVFPVLDNITVASVSDGDRFFKPPCECRLGEQVDVISQRSEISVGVETVHCPLIFSPVCLFDRIGNGRARGHGKVASREGHICSERRGGFRAGPVSYIVSVAAVKVGDADAPRHVIEDTPYGTQSTEGGDARTSL